VLHIVETAYVGNKLAAIMKVKSMQLSNLQHKNLTEAGNNHVYTYVSADF
jgi:hypothetical protein